MQKHEYESTPRDCTRNAPSYFTSALGNISGIFYEATIRCCVRPAGGALSRTRRFLCHSPAEAVRSASAPTMVATSPPGFVAGRYGKDQMSCVTRKTTIFYHTAIANDKRGISSPTFSEVIYPSFQKSPIKPYENLFSHPFFFIFISCTP